MRTRKVVSIVIGAALAGAAVGFVVEQQSARDGARLFDEVLSTIQSRFVDSVDAGALYEKAAEGLVAELKDPYSELFSPKDLEKFETTTAGRYGGVGMLIEDHSGVIVISRVYPNTPAARAGMREGDRILQIEGDTTHGWTTQQVSDKMKGVPGTPVHVKFSRVGLSAPFDITFSRAQIRIPAVPYALVLDGSVGYIPLTIFNETAAPEIRAQLQRLQREGAKSFVLDLRGNTGGLLQEALDAANLFLNQGQEILSLRSRAEPEIKYMAEDRPVAPSAPLVILTDGSSASASEIVAGALQDHDRALLIGTTSFGKGLVQTMYQLDGGWAIKITTGKWFTPSGRSIHKPRVYGEPEEPDTATGPEDIANRPVFKSDAGRTVYGGGAITPDLFIRGDTITTPERVLAQKIFAKADLNQIVYVETYDYALTLRDSVKPSFTVSAEWREELYRRVHAKAPDFGKAEWDAGHTYIDRLLADRLSHLAFGDSTTKRREVKDDAQLMKALEILRNGHTQQELFTLAAGAQPPKKR